MSYNNPYKTYENNSIFTASPEELTLMLYDGAIKFTNKAIIAIEKKDMQSAHTYIIRVEDIIREFQITLDMKYPISAQLNDMYNYIHGRLVEANVKKSIEILEECLELIRELRDTWKEVIKKVRTS